MQYEENRMRTTKVKPQQKKSQADARGLLVDEEQLLGGGPRHAPVARQLHQEGVVAPGLAPCHGVQAARAKLELHEQARAQVQVLGLQVPAAALGRGRGEG